MNRLIVIPRWAGTSADDWYPWLRNQLPAHGFRINILDVPDWNAPDVTDSVDFLLRHLPADQLSADTILVGHSGGGQLIIRYLAHVARPKRTARIGPCRRWAACCAWRAVFWWTSLGKRP